MSIPKSVADVIENHLVLEVEGIDRMYLNVYQPGLQHGGGAASFFGFHRGEAFATARTMARMTRTFIAQIYRFAEQNDIPVIPFPKGQRKDDIALARYADFDGEEGLVFIKFCSYFPYTARLCINGHEYLKRQLTQKGIDFEPLDNGVLSCEDPKRMQAISDGLSAAKIDRLLRKWLRRLPHPFKAKDRKAGYRYDLSILQAQFALTQVLDQPVSGRVFFEQVIRQNLDVGRPDKVQLVFNRRVTRCTPGRFRTRVITQGVTPSLHVDYKNTHIKQYHNDVSIAPPATSRLYRPDSQDTPLRSHRLGHPYRPLLCNKRLRHPASARRSHVTSGTSLHQNAIQNPPQVRKITCLDSRTTTRCLKLDSFATTSVE